MFSCVFGDRCVYLLHQFFTTMNPLEKLTQDFGAVLFTDVYERFCELRKDDPAPLNELDFAELLLMLAVAEPGNVEHSTNQLWRKETGELVNLLVERLRSPQPDGDESHIKKLSFVEISADSVRFVYENYSTFVGKRSQKPVTKITRLSGDFWRSFFLAF